MASPSILTPPDTYHRTKKHSYQLIHSINKERKSSKKKERLLLLRFFHYGKISIASYGINYIVEAQKGSIG
ncbi:MAG: hypothetical protein U9Q38_06045, partial [Thermodesulfobacteriota bacterium]|nr:hypothetical protein [Thermodesulfobacteriota bacterium]